MKEYKVAELFSAAFGIKQPIYSANQTLPNISLQGVKTLPNYYDPESTSWMGTPILFTATFKGDSYMQYNDFGVIEQRSLKDFTLPPATLFSFRRGKNVTKTNLLGSNGTVKEIFGFDDWIIDVRGVALDEPNRSAEQQIDELLKWERLTDAIKVSGKLFNQRKIDRVVMMDWTDNLQASSPGVMPFQFQLNSDEAIELIL